MKTQNWWDKIYDKKIGRSIALSEYIKQSFMAFFFLLIFFLVWNRFIPLSNQVIFSAVASSTFLSFFSTNIYESLSTKIIGGQITGVTIGAGLWYGKSMLIQIFPNLSTEIFIIALSLSAGLSVLFMSILDFEHPPAAGTAMAFVFNPIAPVTADFVFVVLCAILLGSIHYILKKRHLLKDLD